MAEDCIQVLTYSNYGSMQYCCVKQNLELSHESQKLAKRVIKRGGKRKLGRLVFLKFPKLENCSNVTCTRHVRQKKSYGSSTGGLHT